MILRRRRLWFVVLVGLVLAGGVWAWVWWSRTSADALWASTSDQITIGMSRDQVLAIMGRPSRSGLYGSDEFQTELWWAIDGFVFVHYNREHRVASCKTIQGNVAVVQLERLKNRIMP